MPHLPGSNAFGGRRIKPLNTSPLPGKIPEGEISDEKGEIRNLRRALNSLLEWQRIDRDKRDRSDYGHAIDSESERAKDAEEALGKDLSAAKDELGGKIEEEAGKRAAGDDAIRSYIEETKGTIEEQIEDVRSSANLIFKEHDSRIIANTDSINLLGERVDDNSEQLTIFGKDLGRVKADLDKLLKKPSGQPILLWTPVLTSEEGVAKYTLTGEFFYGQEFEVVLTTISTGTLIRQVYVQHFTSPYTEDELPEGEELWQDATLGVENWPGGGLGSSMLVRLTPRRIGWHCIRVWIVDETGAPLSGEGQGTHKYDAWFWCGPPAPPTLTWDPELEVRESDGALLLPEPFTRGQRASIKITSAKGGARIQQVYVQLAESGFGNDPEDPPIEEGDWAYEPIGIFLWPGLGEGEAHLISWVPQRSGWFAIKVWAIDETGLPGGGDNSPGQLVMTAYGWTNPGPLVNWSDVGNDTGTMPSLPAVRAEEALVITGVSSEVETDLQISILASSGIVRLTVSVDWEMDPFDDWSLLLYRYPTSEPPETEGDFGALVRSYPVPDPGAEVEGNILWEFLDFLDDPGQYTYTLLARADDTGEVTILRRALMALPFNYNVSPSSEFPEFPEGSVLYWPFDNEDGLIVEGTENEYDLELQSYEFDPYGSYAEGILGNALRVYREDQTAYLHMYPYDWDNELNPTIVFSQDWSAQFWIKDFVYDTRTTHFGLWFVTSGRGFGIDIIAQDEGDGLKINFRTEWYTSFTGGTDDSGYIITPTEGWNHFVFTRESSTGRIILYMNGEQVYSSTFVVGPPIAPGSWGEVYTYIASASLDEMGVWDRVLTEEEVKNLYNNGQGLPHPNAIS